eukprot:460282_1
MTLLTEYPYICNVCKYLSNAHNYRKLIKTLKLVIDRHIKRLLTMSTAELNIFIELLLEFMIILHSESTISLDQEFETSVIYAYLQISELILKHPTLHTLIPNNLKIRLSLQIISIYYDYSRFKQIDTSILESSIHLASITPKCHYELIKLIIINCNIISFISIDSDKQNGYQLISNIDSKITQILNKTQTKLPYNCKIFLQLVQITLRIRYDQIIQAGQLLIQTNNNLFNTIIKNDTNNDNNKKTNGRKRTFSNSNVENDLSFERPRKRQKLNNTNSIATNNNNNNNNQYIMDNDICLLINYCALMNSLWILRNG